MKFKQYDVVRIVAFNAEQFALADEFNLRRSVVGDDGGRPGCVLTDADGIRHEFVEKEPVIRTGEQMSGSHYPHLGHIRCVIEEKWVDELGRSLVRVNTEKPWSIESVAGETKFTVFKEQIFSG